MKTRNRRDFLFWVLLMLGSLGAVLGQVPTGSVGGVVLDESSAAIQGAKVTVVNKENGSQRSALSGSDGSFLVAALPPGDYEVRAEAKGFRTLVQVTTVRTGITTIRNTHSLLARACALNLPNPGLGRLTDRASCPRTELFTMGIPHASADSVPLLRATVDNPALERHFSIQEVAEMWNLCENSIRAIFKSEPGVVQIERPRSRWKRGYSTLRIPQSVLERVHRRMSRVE
jgi:hypothetical protein